LKTVFATIFAVIFIATTASAFPTELRNPGFESSNIFYFPWYSANNPNSTHILDSVVSNLHSHSGGNSLRLNSAGIGYPNILKQTLGVSPGTTYKISGYLKTQLVKGYCNFGLEDDQFIVNTRTQNTYLFKDWAYFEKEVWIPNISRVDFTLQMSSGAIGSCFFDDLSIVNANTGGTDGRNAEPTMNLTASDISGEAPLRVRFDLDCSDAEDDQTSTNYPNQFCRVVFDAANNSDEIGQTNVDIIRGNLLSGVAGTSRSKISFNWNTNNAKWVEVEYTEPGTYNALGIAKDQEGAKGTDSITITVEATEQNTPPILSGIPNITLVENDDFNERVDLFAFASDAQDSDTTLNFSITNQTNSGLINCFIESDRYVNCNDPTANRNGSNTITVRVTDSDGLTDTDSFTITVEEEQETNSPPVLSGIPDITLEENEDFTEEAIDLFDFASDNEDADSELDFSITTQTNTGLINCFIVSNRIVHCSDPTINGTGTSTITVRVTDTEGLTDTDSFVIQVLAGNENNDPTISGLPDITVQENDGSQNDVIDLFEFAFDNEDSDTALNFSVTNQTNSGLINCFVDQDRYIDCSAPEFNDSGSNDITVRVTDTDGRTDEDTFRVRVEADTGGDNDSPIIEGLPNVDIEENSGYSGSLIDLRNYTSDDFDSDSELDFRIENQSNTSLINCLIVSNRFFECESPRVDATGTSTITIEVEDTDGATDSDTLTVEVFPENGSGNGSCSLIDVETRTIFLDESDRETVVFSIRNRANDNFIVEDVDVFDNSTFLSIGTIDFDSFIREDNNEDLSIDLVSNSVTSDREVSVTIDIRGQFENGEDCSFSEIERETFRVRIDNDGGTGNNNGVCSDIDVITRTVTMDESDTENVSFEIRNNGNDEFRIIDVDVSESSSFLSVSNIDWDNLINEDDEGNLEFDLRSTSVSSDRTDTVEIEIRGEFADGEDCSFSEIGRETFRVEIDNGGGTSSGVCSDIDLTVSNVTVPENTKRTHFVTIDNDNSRDFTITNISVTDNSSYFSVDVQDEPNRIDAGDSERIELEIDADSVTTDRTGSAEVRVSGRYSNGTTCSSTSIKQNFNVTVDNRTGTNDDDDSDSGSVGIEFSSIFVTLNKGETQTVKATIENNLDDRQCFNLGLVNNNFVSARLSNNELCLNSEASGSVDIIINGTQAGSGNVQFKADYDGKSKSKFVSVEVLGATSTGNEPRVSVEVPENITEMPTITVKNTGSDQENVTIVVVNAPEGVTIRPVSKALWRTGEELELEIELPDGFEGEIDSTIRVNTDTGSRSIPLNIEVQAAQQEEFLSPGLVGLATNVGIALGILILIILAVIGILSVFGKK